MDNKPKQERGWDINSWEGLRKALAAMYPRTKLYEMVKVELKKRGNWKNAPRGPWKKEDK